MTLFDKIYDDIINIENDEVDVEFKYDSEEYDNHTLCGQLKITIKSDLIVIEYQDLKLYARYYFDDILMTMRAIEYAFIAYEYACYRIVV